MNVGVICMKQDIQINHFQECHGRHVHEYPQVLIPLKSQFASGGGRNGMPGEFQGALLYSGGNGAHVISKVNCWR